jgi:hypothetical protein
MRITVVDIDSDDHQAAMAAIAAALGRTNGSPSSTIIVAPAPKPRELEAAPVEKPQPLSPELAAAWSWLVAHDNPKGSTPDEMAEGMQVPFSTATYRVNQLVRKGVARRIARGRYRAGEP